MSRNKKANGYRIVKCCNYCNRPFESWESDKRKFCSVDCYGNSMKKKDIVRAYGDKFYLRNHGYYSSNITGRYLHRVVWEENNGEIADGFIVHHIDGDTKNNNISNLALMSKSDHMKMHYAENSGGLRGYNESISIR